MSDGRSEFPIIYTATDQQSEAKDKLDASDPPGWYECVYQNHRSYGSSKRVRWWNGTYLLTDPDGVLEMVAMTKFIGPLVPAVALAKQEEKELPDAPGVWFDAYGQAWFFYGGLHCELRTDTTVSEWHANSRATRGGWSKAVPEQRERIPMSEEIDTALKVRCEVTPKQEAVKSLMVTGGQMANLCFNLGQSAGQPVSEHNAEMMRQLQREWDQHSKIASRLMFPKQAKASRP